jgi:E3 ubiquitin-protein ligase UBR7
METVSAEEVLESLETGTYSTKECSYSKGYVCQAIFACEDCERSGVCFGCAMTCHKDHTLYELYEKRHFKCDCGTDKMKGSHVKG